MTQVVAAVIGITLIFISLQEAFVVVLLPRAVRHRRLIVSYFFGATWAIWTKLASLYRSNGRREGFLAVYGPLAMVLLFVTWAASLIVGFGCLQWSLEHIGSPVQPTLFRNILISGDVFFTLGYSNFEPPSVIYHLLTILEAGTGFGFIAISVSYLPVLYIHFSERDRQLIQLGSRAGLPPTAAALLQRFARESNRERLDEWLHAWEVWATELIESHSSYPMLAFYRSQHENQSWLASLAVILDCCTLIITGSSETMSLQAGSTFATMRRVLVEISRALGTKPTHIKREFSELTLECFDPILAPLQLQWLDKSSAIDTVDSLRACYEPLLEGLSLYLSLPLPKWNTDKLPMNWEGPNSIAKRLIQSSRE